MKNIYIALNLNVVTGRDEVIGILRHKQAEPDWDIHILSSSELMPLLRSKQSTEISGLITSCLLDDELTAILPNVPFPCVLFEASKKKVSGWKTKISLVKSDNEEIGRLGARHFLSLGHFASYAFVKSKLPHEWSSERAAAFQSVLAAAKTPTRIFPPKSAPSAIDDPKALQRWLKALPKPAAVMAAYDGRAVEVLNACKTIGVRVPDQVAILGVDNDALYCENVTPMLSSIQQNCEKEGLLAARELSKLLKSRKRAKNIRVTKVPPSKLIERESTVPTKPSVVLVERALSYIRDNACSGIHVKDVSDHLGISRRLLDLRFREATGGTVSEEINRTRFVAVEKAIKNGETSARKIALQCGFRNVKYLQNLYTRKYGRSIRAAALSLKGQSHLEDQSILSENFAGRSERKKNTRFVKFILPTFQKQVRHRS